MHATSGYTFNAPMSTLQGLANSLKELQQLLAPAPVQAAFPLDSTDEEQQAAEDLQQLQEVMADPEIADDIATLKQLASEAESLIADLSKKEQLKQTAASDDKTPKVGAAEANQASALYGHIQDSVPQFDLPQGGPKQALHAQEKSSFSEEMSHATLVKLTAFRKKLEAYADSHPEAKANVKMLLQGVGIVFMGLRYTYVHCAGALGGYAKDGKAGMESGAKEAVKAFEGFENLMASGKGMAENEVKNYAKSMAKTPTEAKDFAKTAEMSFNLLGMALGLKGAKKLAPKGGKGHVGSHQPVKAPNFLAAFPDAKKVKAKTYVQGGGNKRDRWQDKKYIYEWDSQHGTVEKYNKQGKHLGEFDHITGKELKPKDPKRSVEK